MLEVIEKSHSAPQPAVCRGSEQESGTVAVVGLGYVGLPLAVEFGKRRPTVGFDLSRRKIENLERRVDTTGEVSAAELQKAQRLRVTPDPAELEHAEFVIVAVPTPINAARQPDLGPLESASATVGRHLKPGATVIYESTVYPGATEEVCVPILEKHSGMRWRQDFHVGYSPERINPGDREHSLARIVKVVSGDDPETLEKVAELYASVVSAGVHRVSSIRVAEAAKVIENTQRDLNIAFVNELAIIFDKLGLDTLEVLNAARINDGMGAHIARKTVQQMILAGRNIKGARVNVLGVTFKENCPDVRNSKVIDIIHELRGFGVETFVHDPAADAVEVLREYDLRLRSWEDLPAADALILAVSHRQFLNLPAPAYMEKVVRRGCIIDVKSVLDPTPFRKESLRVWRL